MIMHSIFTQEDEVRQHLSKVQEKYLQAARSHDFSTELIWKDIDYSIIPEILTVPKIAKIMMISEQTVRNRIRGNLIVAWKWGEAGAFYIPRKSFLAYWIDNIFKRNSY